jgi:amidophosphoribosyltransferase
MNDKPHEECGVIAMYAPREQVSTLTYFGLFALQHRGQEAAGIAVADGEMIHEHKGLGLVSQVFNQTILRDLTGHLSIGHTRYSTSGSSTLRNAQPFLIDTQHGPLAMAHNGNLVNAAALRRMLLQRGVGLSSTSDSALLTMMLAGATGDTWIERIKQTMPHWQGAYSLVVLLKDEVLAVRDPWGFRPLNLGQLPQGGYAIASETCALQTLGCEQIREIKAGEIISLSAKGLIAQQGMAPLPELARCTFEHIYFSRPDSEWDDLSIHHIRQRLGRALWQEAPVEADIVVPIPDSSIPAAIGYSQASGIPYNDGLIKNRYIGRTFIEPTDSLRRQGVALKFNALEGNLKDKRVVVIDDSIVRGNTSGPLVKLLRKAGAREVHMRITCPPIAHPCFMGVDMGTYDELIAHRMNPKEIEKHINCDSLHFLSLDGMMAAIGRRSGYCNACFTGKYPLAVDAAHEKTGFEQ